MGWVQILLLATIIFLIYEVFKHKLIKNIFKLVVVGIILFLILTIASNFFDFGEFFSKQSVFAKTGAAIADAVRENIDPSGLLNTTILNEEEGIIGEFTE